MRSLVGARYIVPVFFIVPSSPSRLRYAPGCHIASNLLTNSLSSSPTESVNRPGPRNNLTTMRNSLRNEIFLSRLDGNPFALNDQRVAPLHHDHVFIVLMRVRSGTRRFAASPKRHLTPIRPVKHVTLNSGRRLTTRCNPVLGTLHELREIVHRCIFLGGNSRIHRECVNTRLAFRSPLQKRLTLSPSAHRIFTAPRRSLSAFVALRGQDKYPDASFPSACRCRHRLLIHRLHRRVISPFARRSKTILAGSAESCASRRSRRSL